MNNKQNILMYAKDNKASFERGGVSSNEVHFFDYEGKKYVLKTPLMVKDNVSPFWQMMKNIFDFTFEKQMYELTNIYSLLKENPHIHIAPFVVADEEMVIYEFVEGTSWYEDEFPKGVENAYRLGQYVGYNHQTSHKNCGLLGIEDVTEFFSVALSHMEECINTYWSSEEMIDKRVRKFFENIKGIPCKSIRYSLMMVDICADQFLYDGENIAACVDLDAYVIGPIEWELSFLRIQVEDWDSFKRGYETYQELPEFEEISDFFFFLMGLNSYANKSEMEEYWSKLFAADF